VKEPTTWGRWTFDRKALVLAYRESPNHYPQYEIDLERCNTSAEVLDWICQLEHKCWTSAEDIGNLVSAFDDLLRPQTGLCSFGCDTKVPVTRQMLLDSEVEVIASRIVEAAEQQRKEAFGEHPPLSLLLEGRSLGQMMADHERAEDIIRRYPRRTFQRLLLEYRRESAARNDQAA
jgi:hypothetical protein